jgi:gluconate kinase
VSEPSLPPGDWLPAAASWRDRALWVHWTDFGAAPLSEPFFEQSVGRVLRKPFNRLFPHSTPIEALARAADAGRLVPPDGFVFHMSRCGSTLVSQMLAALPGAIAISEAGPIETIVAARRVRPDLREEERARWLAWMIGALGRARRGDERRCFVKLDAWHALDLPLFRRAFPSTPWIFLYRDPVETLVSHLRRRGMHMTPPLVAAERFGLEAPESWLDPARYCARVLAAICLAAADGLALGGGLLVNYSQLPHAVATAILPHFGVSPDARDRAAMAAAARRDAKSPGLPFAADSVAKQREASAEARTLAERWLGGVYRRLEALRLGAPIA